MPYLKSVLVLAATSRLATISSSAFADEPVSEGPRRVEVEPPPEPPAVEEPPLVEASPVRKNIGIAFTAVGIAHMTVGSAVLAGLAAYGGPLGAAVGGMFGAPIHLEGTIFMSVGVPLWVTGSQRVRRPAPAPAAPDGEPEVSFGPGTASMTWTF
ncbi:MAG: hypothetical protein HOV80_29915 [Polyangiaceae bacterium]|nr:hypothetical protein [Polyangiaceae bacterium]